MQDTPSGGGGNVVKLFFTEADLQEAWERFDRLNIALHDLYRDPESTADERVKACLAAAEAEKHFRDVYRRLEAPRLLSA